MDQSHFKKCIAFPEGKALALSFDGALYLLDNGRMTRLYEGVDNIEWYKEPFIEVINEKGQSFLIDKSLVRFDYAHLSRAYNSCWRVLDNSGRYGIADKDLNVIIPCEYDDIKGSPDPWEGNYPDYWEGSCEDGKAPFYLKRNGKWGVVDYRGKELVPCDYDKIRLSGQYNVQIVVKEGKYDLRIDGRDCHLSYDEIAPVRGGVFRVKKDGKYGCIDMDLNELSPCIYDGVDMMSGFGDEELIRVIHISSNFYQGDKGFKFWRKNEPDGLIPVKKDGKYGLIDNRGNRVAECKYDIVDYGLRRKDSLILVMCDGNMGLLAAEGSVVLESKYKFRNGELMSDDGALYHFSDNRLSSVAYGADSHGDAVLFNGREWLRFKDITIEGPSHIGEVKDWIELSRILKIKSKATGLFGLMFDDGTVCQEPVFSEIDKQQVCKDGKQGYLSVDGILTVPVVYSFLKEALFSCPDTLFVAAMDDRYGIIDVNNRIIVPFEYEKITGKSPYFLLEKDGKKSLAGRNGAILPNIYVDDILTSYDGFVIEYEGKRYYLDESEGLIPVSADAESVKRLTDDLFVVRKKDKYGLFSRKKGKVVAPCRYKFAWVFGKFVVLKMTDKKFQLFEIEKNALVKETFLDRGIDGCFKNNRFGIIEYPGGCYGLKTEEGVGLFKDGQWVTPHNLERVDGIDDNLYLANLSKLHGSPDFQIISFATGKPAELSFDDGAASAHGVRAVPDFLPGSKVFRLPDDLYCCELKDGKVGCLDIRKDIVIPFEYEYLYYGDGLFYVRNSEHRWGVLDRDNRTVIPFEYAWLSPATENLIPAIKKGKLGYIDTRGNTVVPFAYDFVVNKERLNRYGSSFVEIFHYHSGRCWVRKGEKYGLLDSLGKELTSFIYENAFDFSEGLAAIQRNGQWGFVDKTGQEVIPPSWQYASFFQEGLAPVVRNNKWGFIDTEGTTVIEPQYYGAYPFSEGLAQIVIRKKDPQWNYLAELFGYIDRSGKEVIAPKYDRFDIVHDLAVVSPDVKGRDATANAGGRSIVDWRKMSVVIQCEEIPVLSEAVHVHLYHITGDLYLVSNMTDRDERMVVRSRKPQKGVIDKSGNIIIPVCYNVLDYCEKESTFRAMVNDPFDMPKIIRRFDLSGHLIDEEQL